MLESIPDGLGMKTKKNSMKVKMTKKKRKMIGNCKNRKHSKII